MAINLRISPHPGPSPCRLPPRLLLLVVAMLTGLVAMPGCSGCNWGGNSPSANAKKKAEEKTPEELEAELERKRKKKLEKPKDDFEPLAVRMLPSNDPSPSSRQPPIHVKPGHWIAVSETAKTNNFDFSGELATFVEDQGFNLPLEIEDTTARHWNWCPAVLPKGQAKRVEAMFYVPRREKHLMGAYSVRSELHGIRGGRTEIYSTIVSQALKDYEHLIVVLAGGNVTPAAYTHFDKLLSVKMPDVEATQNETLRYYHVVRPLVEKTAPLPSHPLAWTTIAYLFWDDLDPAILTNQQQQALLDWLHWGGQLVISGPSSLDKLKGSFLAPYLPGESTETARLLQADFDELNQKYSLERDPTRATADAPAAKGQKLRRIMIAEERPMVGVDLRLHAAGRPMEGTGGLVVERRLGGGRVVVTRFPLTDVRIKQWKNFDGFFNSVLLRRPGRVFSNQNDLANLDMRWDDPNLSQMLLEPRLGSTLRYFTRDVAFEDDKWATDVIPPPSSPDESTPQRPGFARPVLPGMSNAPVYGNPGNPFRGFGMPADFERHRPESWKVHPAIDDWHFCGYGTYRMPKPNEPLPDPTGVAAWNDDGAASSAARQILTEAAGIEIPTADFVAKVLAIYLLVLVPLNWFVFWLIGKIEWAWVAAPLIALVGAGAVIRLAQLDIGFARSRTEVAVLEVQGGYERAHLTRYTALYSSLSSSYTLAFEEPTAVAAPFPSGKQDDSLISIKQYTDVAFRRGSETSLTGVQVSSNSTGMVHSEQMLSLGTSPKTVESLRLVGDEASGYSVSNTTDLTIRDIGVFRRPDNSQGRGRSVFAIEAAYVATLEPASSAPLRFLPLKLSELAAKDKAKDERANQPLAYWLEQWNKTPIFALPRGATGDEDETQEPGLNEARIRLTRLARLAADRLRLLPGDVRMIGWTDQRLPGMKIRPEAPQNVTYTLVLAHLARGHLSPARPDRNLAEDFVDPTVLEPEPSATENPLGIDYDTTTSTSPSP
jgi:hypothetical protein